MRLIVLLSTIFLLFSAEKCNKSKGVYRGKLEIKAMCMNYTIRILNDDVDTSLVVSNWKDEHSGKSYSNVFALGSKCTFPSTIKEGDEFNFIIDSTDQQNCPVCMAYYPTPSKKLMIKVVEK